MPGPRPVDWGLFTIMISTPRDSGQADLQETDTGQVRLSVVIPVYNAEGCLDELHRRLVKSLEALSLSFEIIMIEDCGADRSWAHIQHLAQEDKRLRGFKLSRNFGQHNAITAGLDQVRGSWVIIMDCDLQDKPEDIHRLIDKSGQGYDLVIARSAIRHDGWAKRFTSDLFYRVLSWLSGYQYEKGVRPFRIMSARVVKALQSMPEQTRTLGPLMEWIGFSRGFIDVDVEPRYSGHSSYSWRRLLDLAAGTILAYSDKPLRMSISVGFIMAGCAFCYGAFTTCRALVQNIPVPGWTSLITSLYFIGGLILANLGVIGIYLGRTFAEAKGRPLYLISHSTSQDARGGAEAPLLPLGESR
jgi:glycosyltransferase involved in cell wall biosynthesis